jgi:hypothetical protein
MALVDPRTTARYGLAKPAGTHRRPATCAEVACRFHLKGWQMRVEESTPLGARQTALIKASGRHFTTVPEQGAVRYLFEAGQSCFRAHSVDIGRPALYIVRQGASAPIRHTRPDDWVDDFSTHLDKLKGQ